MLLSVGLNTPSLRLRESNATLHSAKFNIDRDIPSINPAFLNGEDFLATLEEQEKMFAELVASLPGRN